MWLLVGGVVVAGDVMGGAGGMGDAVGDCAAGGADGEGGVGDGAGDGRAGDAGAEGGVGNASVDGEAGGRWEGG